jgi:hypothetical protein
MSTCEIEISSALRVGASSLRPIQNFARRPRHPPRVHFFLPGVASVDDVGRPSAVCTSEFGKGDGRG